jgi:hypothetical protein
VVKKSREIFWQKRILVLLDGVRIWRRTIAVRDSSIEKSP